MSTEMRRQIEAESFENTNPGEHNRMIREAYTEGYIYKVREDGKMVDKLRIDDDEVAKWVTNPSYFIDTANWNAFELEAALVAFYNADKDIARVAMQQLELAQLAKIAKSEAWQVRVMIVELAADHDPIFRRMLDEHKFGSQHTNYILSMFPADGSKSKDHDETLDFAVATQERNAGYMNQLFRAGLGMVATIIVAGETGFDLDLTKIVEKCKKHPDILKMVSLASPEVAIEVVRELRKL